MTRRLALLAASMLLVGAAEGVTTFSVVPSQADPTVTQFDEPSIVLRGDAAARPPLVVFLSGSYGKPANNPAMLATVAGQGYRVIALAYNDAPAVLQVCARDPDPDCSAKFREIRTFGTGRFAQRPNPPAEAIVPRLVAALRWLDAKDPAAGWGGYLQGGAPRWDRIVVSGLSQGAGMAAFIAKRYAVRRVVLFSSPWDFAGADRRPAPWLSGPSMTPADRWFAEYHAREAAVGPLRAAYATLAIPADHVRVFDLDLPEGVRAGGANPYHGITIRDRRYAAQWRAMFGRGE